MIQFDKSYFDNITKDKIAELLSLAQPYFNNAAELYTRYRRKANENAMMGSGGKTAMPYEYYSVNMASGYIAGNAPAYTVADDENDKGYSDEYQKHIDHIRRYNDDGATFLEITKDLLMKTRAYLYVTENENNEIVYTRLDSLNTVCVYDYGTPPYPIALMRVWAEKDKEGKDVKRVEIVTSYSRRIFGENGEVVPFIDFDESGKKTEVTEKLLIWGNPLKGVESDVPIVPFEEPDGIAVFEPAVSLVENMETVITNVAKALKYNDAAKLVISGYDSIHPYTIVNEKGEEVINPAREREDAHIYSAPTLIVGEGGNVNWLLKNVDFSGAISYIDKANEFITLLNLVPNITDDSFSNASSGVALGYKFYGFDQRAANYYSVFRKGYTRLWELITNRINLKNRTEYDFRDIDIKFIENKPTDVDRTADRAARLYSAGVISLETAINISGIEIDATSEILKIAAEKLKIKTIQEVRFLLSDKTISKRKALSLLFSEEEIDEILAELSEEEKEEFEGEFDETEQEETPEVALF